MAECQTQGEANIPVIDLTTIEHGDVLDWPAVIELHVHTNPDSSDSMLSKEELVTTGKMVGLTGANLAEHDKVLERHQPVSYTHLTLPTIYSV